MSFSFIGGQIKKITTEQQKENAHKLKIIKQRINYLVK